MNEVVVCEPLRTPVGRFGGVLQEVPPADLAVTVVHALLERTGLDPGAVDDVILGQCNPNGEAPAIGRVVALDAGLPVETPGAQVDRRCGSGLQAVLTAIGQVATGASQTVLAGGTENMSQVEYYARDMRFRPPTVVNLTDRLDRARRTAGGRNHPVPGGMVETAENVRKQFGISRSEQDELALRSHRRAVAAQDSGAFAEEIVQVRAGTTIVERDEHPRADTDLDALGKLRAVRARVDADATVTAGNSSGQNDGAALCLVTTRERAERLDVRVTARLCAWSVCGVAPELMGLGPVPAVAACLDRAGVELKDVDLIELNEAFAAQVLGCTRSWGFGDADFERLNVNGSGISLGHPVGATGARILATGLRELARRDGRYLLETMCIGGGQGMAALFERV